MVIYGEVFGYENEEFSCVIYKDTTNTCSVVVNAWNLANRKRKRSLNYEVKT